MKVQGGCATETGPVKPVNQDSILFCCRRYRKTCIGMGLVCDGISGLSQGELAATVARNIIYEWFGSINDDASPEEITASLETCLQDANRCIREEFRRNRGILTGATLSLCFILDHQCSVYQAGDSRVYRLEGQSLLQITRDQTVLQERGNRLKACLSNYLGKEDEFHYEKTSFPVKKNDVFLYCSDGFYKKMADEDWKWLTGPGSHVDWDRSCRRMAEAVLARGERDNISVGILRVKGRGGWFENLFRKRGTGEKTTSMGQKENHDTDV